MLELFLPPLQSGHSPLTPNKAFSSREPPLTGYFLFPENSLWTREMGVQENPSRSVVSEILRSKSCKSPSPFACSVWTLAGSLDHVYIPKWINLLPCDSLIRYFCLQNWTRFLPPPKTRHSNKNGNIFKLIFLKWCI